MTEIVYVFTNPAMPGYVKIGKTSQGDVKQRLKALSNPSGIPVPFQCEYAAVVNDATKVEEALHKAFHKDRPNKKREFFKIDPQQIITLLKGMYGVSDATPETNEILDQVTSTEDKLSQSIAIVRANEHKADPKGGKSARESIDEAKAKEWDWIVKNIGSKSPAFSKFRGQLQKHSPPTKDNVHILRAIIEKAPKSDTNYRFRYKLVALLEILKEKFG